MAENEEQARARRKRQIDSEFPRTRSAVKDSLLDAMEIEATHWRQLLAAERERVRELVEAAGQAVDALDRLLGDSDIDCEEDEEHWPFEQRTCKRLYAALQKYRAGEGKAE